MGVPRRLWHSPPPRLFQSFSCSAPIRPNSASLRGGNMTGLTAVSSELMGKRLDLLREMNPLATTVAYLIDPRAQDSEEPTRAMVAAARELGRQALIQEARSESDIDGAFATLDERGAGALVVGPHVLFQRNAKKIIDF